MRFGNNMMDKINLPSPGIDGPSTYDGSVLLLVHWARNLSVVAPALASRAAEAALFDHEIEHLTKLENFEPLARRMEERQSCYAAHAGGFWGSRAGHRVPWRTLLSLARAATVLRQHLGVERRWTSPGEAVTWFTTQGWEVDRLGELLFRDDPELPGGLYGVRARLRLAYLRHVDSINSVFSELLHHHGVETLGLSFAGEVLAGRRPDKEPMAVIVRSYTVPLASSSSGPTPRATRADPQRGDPEVLYTLAEEWYGKAAEADPHHADCRFALALLYEQWAAWGGRADPHRRSPETLYGLAVR
jgi:hypothetical protein